MSFRERSSGAMELAVQDHTQGSARSVTLLIALRMLTCVTVFLLVCNYGLLAKTLQLLSYSVLRVFLIPLPKS